MTRRRKWIILAVQLVAAGFIVTHYLEAQSALVGLQKSQTTSIYEEFLDMIDSGVITLSSDTTPQQAARRLWQLANHNTASAFGRVMTWQPMALGAIAINLVVVGTTRISTRVNQMQKIPA